MIGVYVPGRPFLAEGPAELPDVLAAQGRPIILARIFLDSGTENVSDIGVRHPTRYYEARVMQWGSVTRAVPQPAGLPQISDGRIRIADTDFKFRDLFAETSPEQTPLERLIELRVVRENQPESYGVIVYTGEIVDFEFGDEYVELSFRDITWSWLDEEFPGTMESGVYAPTVFGRCVQNAPVEQHGLIPLTHIGFSVANGDRWIASKHTLNDITIHRHNLDGTWEEVNPSEYSVTEDDVLIGGIAYTGTYIDFTNEQDDGVEIRADIEGWNVRPAWGSLPAATGLLRNPIDLFINIILEAETKLGKTLNCNEAAISALRTQVQTIIDTSPARSHFCDGAILEPITFRSLLSRFVQSFTYDLFQDVHGQINLEVVTPSESSTPITETLNIIERSFVQRLPSPINRFKCKMARSYADGTWSIEQIHDNTADQFTLGVVSSPTAAKITATDLEMWFVRERFTAADAAARRAGFTTLKSNSQEFTLTLDDASLLELCGDIALTIRYGLKTGGFVGEVARVEGITLDLDSWSARIKSRIWREQERTDPSFTVYELDASVTMTYAMDAELYESL